MRELIGPLSRSHGIFGTGYHQGGSAKDFDVEDFKQRMLRSLEF